MSTHIEKQRNGFVLVENKTGRVVAGPFSLRATAEAEIRKREKEKANSGDRYLTRI